MRLVYYDCFEEQKSVCSAWQCTVLATAAQLHSTLRRDGHITAAVKGLWLSCRDRPVDKALFGVEESYMCVFPASSSLPINQCYAVHTDKYTRSGAGNLTDAWWYMLKCD